MYPPYHAQDEPAVPRQSNGNIMWLNNFYASSRCDVFHTSCLPHVITVIENSVADWKTATFLLICHASIQLVTLVFLALKYLSSAGVSGNQKVNLFVPGKMSKRQCAPSVCKTSMLHDSKQRYLPSSSAMLHLTIYLSCKSAPDS